VQCELTIEDSYLHRTTGGWVGCFPPVLVRLGMRRNSHAQAEPAR